MLGGIPLLMKRTIVDNTKYVFFIYNNNIYKKDIADTNTSNLGTQLTTSSNINQLRLNQAGNKILYSSGTKIYEKDLSTGAGTLIFDAGLPVGGICYSADGNWIGYNRSASGGSAGILMGYYRPSSTNYTFFNSTGGFINTYAYTEAIAGDNSNYILYGSGDAGATSKLYRRSFTSSNTNATLVLGYGSINLNPKSIDSTNFICPGYSGSAYYIYKGNWSNDGTRTAIISTHVDMNTNIYGTANRDKTYYIYTRYSGGANKLYKKNYGDTSDGSIWLTYACKSLDSL